MIVCNEDVAGVDASIDCSWYLTARMQDPTVGEVGRRTRDLLRQMLVMGEGFISPTSIKIPVSCLEPSRKLAFRDDRDSEEAQQVEVHSPDGVSRETLFAAIDDVQCSDDTIQFSDYIKYGKLSANLYIDGEDRWVDRESAYLIHWDTFEDQQKSDIDVNADEHSYRDPLEIVLSHGPSPDGTYEHELHIRTFCHLWWADTDAGQVNGERFLDFLGGLAGLDCISKRRLLSNRTGPRELTRRLEQEFDT